MARGAPVLKDQDKPSDRLVRVVHRDTKEQKILSAAQVMALRLADRARRNKEGPENRQLSWKRQHYFVCECCGEGTQLYHHKTSSDGRQTHWSLAPGSRHTNPGCADFEENLDLLVSKGLKLQGDGNFVVNFSSSLSAKTGFDEIEKPNKPVTRTLGVRVNSQNPSNLRVKTVQDMERTYCEIMDVLGPDLSLPVYDRVYVSFGRQKILVRDAFAGPGEIPKIIKHLANMNAENREKGTVFFPVVNVLGFGDNQVFSQASVIECEETPIKYRGRYFRLQIDLVSNDPRVIAGVHKRYLTGAQRVALRIGQGRDPIREMDHIIDQFPHSPDNRVKITLEIQDPEDLVKPNENRNSRSAMLFNMNRQLDLEL